MEAKKDIRTLKENLLDQKLLPMEPFTLDSGWKDWKMVMDSRYGLMDLSMKESGLMIRLTDMEN